MEGILILLALGLPIFIFVSCVAVWSRTNNLREDVESLRRAVSEMRVQLSNLAKQPRGAAAELPPETQAAPPQMPAAPAPAPAPPIPTPAPTMAIQNRAPSIRETAPPDDAAGSMPKASPLPPASPIPPATPVTPPVAPDSTLSQHYTPPAEVRAAFEREQQKIRAEQEARRATATQQTANPAAPASTPAPAAASRPPVAPAPKNEGFEFQFGKRLPVWIGGVSLALAGFYLVKYSIEQGLLTEQVRIIFGYIFGALLVGGARYIREKKPDMADGTRIAQALAGAGIADFYATTYAATQLYHFFPPLLGFVGMAATTALAVVLSVRHGMAIAVLGMMGGFVTPALIRTDHPSAPMLFFYLFCLVTGLFATFRQRGWWVLSGPMMILAFAWVLLWMVSGNFTSDDGIVLGLFILGVSAVVMVPSQAENEKLSLKDRTSISSLNAFTAVGGLCLMGLVTAKSAFGLMDFGLFGLLALGGIIMSFFRPAQFRYVPWLSLGISLFLLAIWRHAPDAERALVELAFAAVYIIPAWFFMRRYPALRWGGLLSAAALGFYGLGYLTIGKEIYPLLNVIQGDVLHLWSAIALILALLFAGLTGNVFRNFAGDEHLRDRFLALFSLVTTAFVSVALLIEVHHDFLAVAFAAETLAVSWVAWKINIKALRQIAGILFTVFLILIFPQLLILGSVTASSLFGVNWQPWTGLPPLADQPLFQLGLPMLMLAIASFFLRLRGDSRIVELMEMACVGLGALMLYYLARHVFKVPDDVFFRKAGFFERGIITNIFFAAALLVVYTGRLYSRRALLWAGSFLFAMAMFRVFYFDLFLANPLWAHDQNVGAAPLFNYLWLPYALPVFWLWLEEKPQLRIATLPRSLVGGFTLALLFFFVTIQVRQFFHGADLRSTPTTDAEIYAYSAVWLLLGAGLLLLGTLKKNKPLRVASLLVMTFTVGKVFLYDIDELTGLYRVFSFMGLGLTLLALSWFYTRFVFKKD
ncbi:MAG TPA: DUF2339 domain-containing protein [Patescibacteria group bacterium]|nr:DUF2339 domain-containing protein [Patescibacteria group bacterium]